MSVAVALSAALLAAPAPDPLTGAELVEALSEGWWCTWEPKLGGCSDIDRYDFEAQTISGCGGSDIWWIETAMALGEEADLQSVAAVRPLLDQLQAEAEAMGADRIKFCQTHTFKRQGDQLCSPGWDLVGKPQMRLSRSGAWRDPDDHVVSGVDSERYWLMWPAVFLEMAAQVPEADRTPVQAKTLDNEGSPPLICRGFERRGDVLIMTSGDIARELRPLTRPEDGVIVPWQ